MRSALGMWVRRFTTASVPANAEVRADLVEDVGLDGVRAELLEQPPAAGGPDDAGDPVAGRQQLADGTPADDAGGSGDGDRVGVHDQQTRHPGAS